jgi:hypothetical protein
MANQRHVVPGAATQEDGHLRGLVPPLRERVGHLCLCQGFNMLLLKDIFKGGQHGQPLSVGRVYCPPLTVLPRTKKD